MVILFLGMLAAALVFFILSVIFSIKYSRKNIREHAVFGMVFFFVSALLLFAAWQIFQEPAIQTTIAPFVHTGR